MPVSINTPENRHVEDTEFMHLNAIVRMHEHLHNLEQFCALTRIHGKNKWMNELYSAHDNNGNKIPL